MPDLKPCEYRCPTCGRLDPFNHAIEDALRAEVARLNARFDTAHQVIAHRENECVMLRAEVAELTAELERWKVPLTDDQIGSVCAIADIDWTSRVDSLDTVIRAVREAGMPLPAAPEANDA